MVRQRRVKFERDGTTYHVMTRTAQQAFLFEDPVVREWIYRKITSLASIFFVDLYSIAVMSNHYHIVLAMRKPSPNEAELQRRFELSQAGRRYPERWFEWRADRWYERLTDLSQFVKALNESVAMYVNRRNQSRGHVWGDRFKSVLVEDGPGLLTCMAYVEMNCVRAGLCSKPSAYRWCSAGRFVQGGVSEAGVVTPPLPGFECLNSSRKRQRGFALFVDYLAERIENEDATFPSEHAEMEALVAQASLESLIGLVAKRTRWMVESLVLGSEGFCTEMINRFRLQPGRHGPRPYELKDGLFNSHQRAGPFLS